MRHRNAIVAVASVIFGGVFASAVPAHAWFVRTSVGSGLPISCGMSGCTEVEIPVVAMDGRKPEQATYVNLDVAKIKSPNVTAKACVRRYDEPTENGPSGIYTKCGDTAYASGTGYKRLSLDTYVWKTGGGDYHYVVTSAAFQTGQTGVVAKVNGLKHGG